MIPIHTLDYAIKQLCSNIKSAETNLIKKNIKRFHIKFWKYNRPSQSIDIEKSCITLDKKTNNYNICFKTFDEMLMKYNNEKFILEEKPTSNIKINYNKITNEYFILIPEEQKVINDKNKRNNIIVCDYGVRTFINCLSENRAIKIGNNICDKIVTKLKKLNKVKKNIDIPKKIKKKRKRITNRKISNMVDDLHWKTIKYMTSNYKHILLGDMSAKNICKKDKSIFGKYKKIAIQRLGYYKFRQRLEYKCKAYGLYNKIVSERLTTKLCSKCGYCKEDVKDNKIYECRNMYIRSC